jgi:hypothetical protein
MRSIHVRCHHMWPGEALIPAHGRVTHGRPMRFGRPCPSPCSRGNTAGAPPCNPGCRRRRRARRRRSLRCGITAISPIICRHASRPGSLHFRYGRSRRPQPHSITPGISGCRQLPCVSHGMQFPQAVTSDVRWQGQPRCSARLPGTSGRMPAIRASVPMLLPAGWLLPGRLMLLLAGQPLPGRLMLRLVGQPLPGGLMLLPAGAPFLRGLRGSPRDNSPTGPQPGPWFLHRHGPGRFKPQCQPPSAAPEESNPPGPSCGVMRILSAFHI